MSQPSKEFILPNPSDDFEKMIRGGPHLSAFSGARVTSIRHDPRWLDTDMKRNIHIVMDDPEFAFPARISGEIEGLVSLSALGEAHASEALDVLEEIKPQIKSIVVDSAVQMMELALPFVAFTRAYKRLNRLAKLGRTRAGERGIDYPPHMALPDYGLTLPETPPGGDYPDPTGIPNDHVDRFIRSTANAAVHYMNRRMRLEKDLHNERRRNERQLRAEIKGTPRRRKKPTVSEVAGGSSPAPLARLGDPIEAYGPESGVGGLVANPISNKRPPPTSGLSLSRPRLDKAGIPAHWRDLTDLEKCQVICTAIHTDTSGISFTADVDMGWMAARKAAGKDVMAEIQQRLSKALRDVVGPGAGFAAVIEADRFADPHLHGVVNLAPTLENVQLVRQALMRFTGEPDLDGKARARRVDVDAFDGDPKFTRYVFKWHATARAKLSIHRVLITSRPAIQLGRALQEQRRAAALSSAE